MDLSIRVIHTSTVYVVLSTMTDSRYIPLAGRSVRSLAHVQSLNDQEINEFLDDLDHNGDGYINYEEVERKLDETHHELAPKPSSPYGSQSGHDSEGDRARHAFLRSIMGSGADCIPRNEFAELVRQWNIPSLQPAKKEEEDEKSYIKRLLGWRKIRAYWAVHGPEIAFIGLVVSLQCTFGIWELIQYQTAPEYRAAFGWGVVMAKTCAGALYPTFFFLILSMSRYFSTWLRRSYHVSRFLNWDLSQKFHMYLACVALLLATLHALGHLTGSFVHASDKANAQAVINVLGSDTPPRSYIEYVQSLPGLTGIVAICLFYLLATLSSPPVRRWNYEVFQLGHLLMFPIIGLLMAHGAAAFFQRPLFGYFLAFPTLVVIVERVVRVLLGFRPINATMRVLDKETVEITAVIPSERFWKYKAGQYVFVQVPKISLFQWHPFTVSFCRGHKMMLHIKTDGNWTGRLRQLGGLSGHCDLKIGINGPFGAPAQRFYDFNHSIIIGAGIGVTPFSGILADLQYNDGPEYSRPFDTPRRSFDSEVTLNYPSNPSAQESVIELDTFGTDKKHQADKLHTFAKDYRRVDFHWMVRDRNYLHWFSDLLNDVSRSQEWHHEHEATPRLDIRLNTHVTSKGKDISTHVYRWLLELHRTQENPASLLTGLINPTDFGRPDFEKILDEHYEEMLEFRASKRIHQREEASKMGKGFYKEHDELKVGVFYCGAPVVGETLADKCRELSTRGRKDGSRLEYHFMIEVFG